MADTSTRETLRKLLEARNAPAKPTANPAIKPKTS